MRDPYTDEELTALRDHLANHSDDYQADWLVTVVGRLLATLDSNEELAEDARLERREERD